MTYYHLYGASVQKKTCPYCGCPECDAEFVDIGVGYQQASPYHCLDCGASEIGPNDKERPLSEKEIQTGWYSPENPSDYVSMINSSQLDSETAMLMYRKHMVNRIPFRLSFTSEEEALFVRGLFCGYSTHYVPQSQPSLRNKNEFL